MEHRRVIVTGLGLICGVGKTAPEVWEGLMAGRSGMAEIKAFDLTGHPVRFAAEVKDFDPLLFVEKKSPERWVASSTSLWPLPPKRWLTPASRSPKKIMTRSAST